MSPKTSDSDVCVCWHVGMLVNCTQDTWILSVKQHKFTKKWWLAGLAVESQNFAGVFFLSR